MISMTSLKPISIHQRDSAGVDAAKESGVGFIVFRMANENAAEVYAGILREVAEILPTS